MAKKQSMPYDSKNVKGFFKVYSSPKEKGVRVYSTSEFFKNEIKIDLKTDKMIITRVGAMYAGKTFNFNYTNGRYNSTLSMEIPIGLHQFDPEESDEDKIVIYF